VPSIPGIEEVDYLTSTSALELEKLPKSLLVIGGGFIGAEFAQMFARVGVQVTIVCRSQLLPAVEPEIAEALSTFFRDEGIRLKCGAAYKLIKRTNGGVSLSVEVGTREEILQAERIVIATGRAADVERLGLKKGAVAQVPNGGIMVDDWMRTSRPGVYAAGDVTGRDRFVYMAAYAARLATKNALNGDSLRYDRTGMSAVAFTDPQIASVGLTEAAARAVGQEVSTSLLPLSNVPRALAARDTRGLIKLVADGTTRKLLGAHILAPEGGDSIQTAALAFPQRFTIDDLAGGVEAGGPGLRKGRGEALLLRNAHARVGCQFCQPAHSRGLRASFRNDAAAVRYSYALICRRGMAPAGLPMPAVFDDPQRHQPARPVRQTANSQPSSSSIEEQSLVGSRARYTTPAHAAPTVVGSVHLQAIVQRAHQWER
jgi:hypothetical protein